MNLGALDATVHGSIGQEYGVRGYPTIKYFAPGSTGTVKGCGINNVKDKFDLFFFHLRLFYINQTKNSKNSNVVRLQSWTKF